MLINAALRAPWQAASPHRRERARGAGRRRRSARRKARRMAARGPVRPRRRSPAWSSRDVCGPAQYSKQCGLATPAGRALRPKCRDGAGHAKTPPALHLRRQMGCAGRSRPRDTECLSTGSPAPQESLPLPECEPVRPPRCSESPSNLRKLPGWCSYITRRRRPEKCSNLRPIVRGPANEKLAEPPAPRVYYADRSPLLLGAKLLRGNGAGGAILVRILHPGPQCAGLVLLAFGGIQVGQIKLRHCGRNRVRWLGNQGVVEINGLRIASGLTIKPCKRKFGQVGEIAVPGARGGLQLSFGGGVLAHFLGRNAGKIAGLAALRQPAVLLSYGRKLRVGGLGAIGGC